MINHRGNEITEFFFRGVLLLFLLFGQLCEVKTLSLINNSVYYPVICKWYLQTCYNASKFPGRNNQTSLNWMGLLPGTL